MTANEVGCRRSIDGALDALAIAIVDEGGVIECTLRRLGFGRAIQCPTGESD